jgi:putative toxin-antitoxin system antitoxin component (TIGR02293 family)
MLLSRHAPFGGVLLLVCLERSLATEECQRIARLSRILMLAKETFEDSDKADRWLRTPKLALEGDRPLDRLHTDAEAQSVE